MCGVVTSVEVIMTPQAVISMQQQQAPSECVLEGLGWKTSPVGEQDHAAEVERR
jgi:hypothetical protein